MSSTPVEITQAAQSRRYAMVLGLLAALVVWSYWPTVVELAAFWRTNEDYSVGQLVPLVAAFLVWRDRRALLADGLAPSLWGLVLLLASQLLRFAGLYYGYASAERYSLVFTLSALVLLLGGGRVFRRLIWLQVFLLLMVPLPNRVHNLIALPLQDWATSLGLMGLELLGYYVAREGNVLTVDDQSTVMVAEACSGLRMLTAFIFTAAVLALLIDRPVWQKVTLLASSIPIAVLSNGLRVLVTAVFIYYARDPDLEEKFHDAAGLLMMPLAVLLLFGELKFLAALSKGGADTKERAARDRAREALAR